MKQYILLKAFQGIVMFMSNSILKYLHYMVHLQNNHTFSFFVKPMFAMSLQGKFLDVLLILDSFHVFHIHGNCKQFSMSASLYL